MVRPVPAPVYPQRLALHVDLLALIVVCRIGSQVSHRLLSAVATPVVDHHPAHQEQHEDEASDESDQPRVSNNVGGVGLESVDVQLSRIAEGSGSDRVLSGDRHRVFSAGRHADNDEFRLVGGNRDVSRCRAVMAHNNLKKKTTSLVFR